MVENIAEAERELGGKARGFFRDIPGVPRPPRILYHDRTTQRYLNQQILNFGRYLNDAYTLRLTEKAIARDAEGWS